MKGRKKRRFSLIWMVILIFSMSAATLAAGNVTYEGNAEKFIFSPGSEYSPTDLFENFKGIMPGDSLTQRITVRNDASNEVKVKIYLRSLGAENGSEDFLSQMHITVSKSSDDQMEYMFEEAENHSESINDWILLGVLYSGGTVDLDVTLDVPISMGNDYQEKIGYLDWQFMVEEFPCESEDPQPPKTGDESQILLYSVMAAAGIFTFILLFRIRQKKKNTEKNLLKNRLLK